MPQNQAPLFRVTDATGDEGNFPQPEISVLRSRDAAGSGSLRALLTPATELRFDGARSTELALIRDWRGYPLLLFSLYGPPEGAQVRFAVHSGTTVPLEWTRTLDVGPGWNLYRIDVAELGDTVDLADVRCLSWRMLVPSAPLELFVDDVILADNTRTVHGESAGPGELYVFEQGRRVHVGVRERFERFIADDGAPLPPEHGFPLRLLVPGFYGTNSVKWLCRLHVADRRSPAITTTRLYNDPGEPRADGGRAEPVPVWEAPPDAVIVAPADRAVVAGDRVHVWGRSWAARGIARVELSFDEGADWIDAEVEPRRGYAWQRFDLRIARERIAHATSIIARATDLAGERQPLERARNACHRIAVSFA